MKRILLFLLLSALSLLAEEKPWPGVEYTEVRAYAWPKNIKTDLVIRKDLSLEPGVINKEGSLLTPSQIKRLQAAISETHPHSPSAMCYIPHNALVFYNAQKKPVAFLEICFGCIGRRAKPENIPRIDYVALASLFEELKLPLGSFESAKAFEQHLNGLKNLKSIK